MKLKRVFAFATCLALATAGCSLGVSANGISSDPNIDAQDVTDKYQAANGDLIPSYDQTCDMTMDIGVQVDDQSVDMSMKVNTKASAYQKRSSADITAYVRAAGRSVNVRGKIFVSKEGDQYRTYAGRSIDDAAWTWGQELMSEDEAMDFYGTQDYSRRVQDFFDSATEVGVREEGDLYIVEIVPSDESLEEMMQGSPAAGQVDDISIDSGVYRLTIDKNTYHLKEMDMEFDYKVTEQGEVADADLKLEGTCDDSQKVTVDVPSQAKDATEGDIEQLFQQ